MSVSPIEIEMTSAGARSRAQIVVTNDGTTPLPVEAVLKQLSLDKDGNRTLRQAGDEFLVFPPQVMIRPGGTQVFRLQWVGEPEIDASKSYLMSVSQVPVKIRGGGNEVQIVVGLGVVINVAPPTGSPSLRVVSAGIVTDRVSGRKHPTIEVENTSKVHALLSQATIDLVGKGWSATLSSAEIRERLGIGLVQPGHRRSFVLPVILPDQITGVAATLNFRPKR